MCMPNGLQNAKNKGVNCTDIATWQILSDDVGSLFRENLFQKIQHTVVSQNEKEKIIHSIISGQLLCVITVVHNQFLSTPTVMLIWRKNQKVTQCAYFSGRKISQPPKQVSWCCLREILRCHPCGQLSLKPIFKSKQHMTICFEFEAA